MAASDEKEAVRKIKILAHAVEGAYSRDALAENCAAN